MSLTGFDDIRWQVEEIEEFASYWRQLPRLKGVPLRSDFNPAEVSHILPDISIYEFDPAGEINIRLAGTRMVETFGQEITGNNFVDFWPSEYQDNVKETFKTMLTTPCGLLVKIIGITDSGKETSGYSVGFPLRDNNEECNLLIFYNCGDIFPDTQAPSKEKIQSLRVDHLVLIDLS